MSGLCQRYNQRAERRPNVSMLSNSCRRNISGVELRIARVFKIYADGKPVPHLMNHSRRPHPKPSDEFILTIFN